MQPQVDKPVNMEALKSEVRAALINRKSFSCPIALRVAWHASGTFDKHDGTGGSDGATMRFEPEISDDANKGLSIVRDMLHEVKKAHPEVSEADLWTYAGAVATEFMGGPVVPHAFGRTDADDGSSCPENGRIPDASKGADHVREFFTRMGFSDRETVALMGGHTVGRAHIVRSGFDGPWTRKNLSFDNEYFRNLMFEEWQVKEWDGPLQYEDVATGELMMLPTDMAMRTDAEYAKWARAYANDQDLFFADFAKAYAKLLALGCPEACNPFNVPGVEPPITPFPVAPAAAAPSGKCPFSGAGASSDASSAKFRELAMHGSVGPLKKATPAADVHQLEASSSRSALHKAAFWGHVQVIDYLCNEVGINPDVQDVYGDTALHDAARFGHADVVKLLLAAGASTSVTNAAGLTPLQVAVEYSKHDVVALLKAAPSHSRL
ncbi:uncharacterized protein AMSG_12124 [Thecamonas trahens ATCC 50062]|uniref:Plant heme peroxidase family profile domain-containing protein n=1 Tax=Thecamonas trahens ATCC 50062 TaxID=461836 RepID=A0A0L0DM46_THETB|nr:hypothetical protein AMSG_12124 [Thecamonas trahens ATCC 50062]KNC52463.1 hypothetical protein AMSG_12124 [Thecamonas trahens ATCC 50062]|eukprot:XP_013755367.1 hypothetical protein AMSG_12124 [Thecamonas trahens ATCC 50062]